MPEMSICVAGWYLRKYDDWYASLHRLNQQFPVFVVANRADEYLGTIDLPHAVRPNAGLEWGAYNWFLMNRWKRGPVLFCHDDITLHPVVKGGKIVEPEYVFEKIASAPVDQAYIFGSRAEDVENRGMHGRMVLMSERFLDAAKDQGGFWYDSKNTGYTDGADSGLRDKMGCYGYNAGIIRFHAQAQSIGGNVHAKIYVPAIDLAKRGCESARDAYGKFIAGIDAMQRNAKSRLHVGCGDRASEGYVNIDLHNEAADIRCDARDIPISDGAFDWVESHHLIEHLPPEGARDALSEWHRLLSPGGHVFITTPDSVALMGALDGAQDKPDLWDGVMGGIYGNDQPGMAHRWGYCRESLTRLIEGAGFENVTVKTVVGYRPTPSLLAIGEKPK